MYRFLVNLFRYIRWLSLDIALGGAILLLYVSKELYNLDVPPVLLLLLVVAILIIYTIDHLMDAQRLSNPTMPRHLFHKNNQEILTYYLIGLALIGCVGLYFVDLKMIVIGIAVSICCGIYLLVNRQLAKSGSKELAVAIVYASAMFAYPASETSLKLVDFVYWLQLSSLALINLMIISYFEHDCDSKDKTTSIAHMIGIKTTKWASIFFLILVSILSLFMWMRIEGLTYHIFVLVASLVLLCVLVFASFFEVQERYRFTCDAIFLIPIAFL